MTLRELLAAMENIAELKESAERARSALSYMGSPRSPSHQTPVWRERYAAAKQAIEEAERELEKAMDEKLPGLLTREALVAAVEASVEHVSVTGADTPYYSNPPSVKLIEPDKLIKELKE